MQIIGPHWSLGFFGGWLAVVENRTETNRTEQSRKAE